MKSWNVLGRCGRRWVVVFALMLGVLALGGRWSAVAQPGAGGGGGSGGSPPKAAEPAAKTVTLVIDFGDGFQKHYTALAWKSGMTVLDALSAAKVHPRSLPFESNGEGAMAFIKSIDGVANQGAQGEQKNWLFSVNTKFADKSAGAYILNAGDAVFWHFGPYEWREE